MDDRSWLFPRGADRQRMLEMDRALRPVRQRAFAVLTVALLACGPWLGWWTTLPLVLAALIFRAVEPMAQRAERPEYAIFAAWAASELIIAISVALTDAPRVATTAWLALPLVTLGGRFSERGIAVGVAYAVALLLAVSFGVNTQAVLDNPPLVIAPLALMVAIGMFQTVIMRSDVKYRTQAILDPLTGVLNRMALAARVAELEQQSEITQHPIGVIAIDLDHFKAINDTHGHGTGDAVLKDLADLLRTSLRAFDPVYRIGGEEFVILLPGADLSEVARVAESIRLAIAGAPIAGVPVTASLGVSASAPGERFVYERVFARADAALYDAKRRGRNCVGRAAGAALPDAA